MSTPGLVLDICSIIVGGKKYCSKIFKYLKMYIEKKSLYVSSYFLIGKLLMSVFVTLNVVWEKRIEICDDIPAH